MVCDPVVRGSFNVVALGMLLFIPLCNISCMFLVFKDQGIVA